MKKLILQNLFFTLVILALCSISCKKDKDNIPPVISLNGLDSVYIQLHSVYSDAGASATDNSDGHVTVTNDHTELNPDTGTACIYTISYQASDVEGNDAHAARIVIVDIRRSDYLGNYSTTHNCPSVGTFSPLESITASAANDKIIISNFAGTNANCTAAVSGQNISIASQQIGIFSNVYGTGTINNKATIISLSYTYTYNALTETCTATFTKQ